MTKKPVEKDDTVTAVVRIDALCSLCEWFCAYS